MRTLLHVIWLVLSGFWMFLGYGIASFTLVPISLMPLGKVIVDSRTLQPV